MRELLTGKILLLCHHNADPDTACSAFGVQRLIETLDPTPKAEIFLPGGASSLTRRIMEELEIATSRRLRGLGDRQRKALLERYPS